MFYGVSVSGDVELGPGVGVVAERTYGRSLGAVAVLVGVLEGEALLVELVFRQPGFVQGVSGRGREAGWAAEVDVTAEQVGNEAVQQLGCQLADVLAGEVLHACAAGGGEAVEFCAEQDVCGRASPVQQQQVLPGCERECFEQCAHRGDPDATGDEQHVPVGAAVGGHRAVGTFGEHPGARFQVLQLCAAVAERFDGQAQVRVAWRGGQRERVRGEPQLRCQEPPAEELPGLGLQLVQVAASMMIDTTPGASCCTAATRMRCLLVLRSEVITRWMRTSANTCV